jgi:hypothetical protein
MKGFFRATFASACLGTSALAFVGCAKYRDLVDPCYPDRYNAEARKVTNDIFDTQAFNGHVLDQTIWNYHFERDEKNNPTDKLNAMGREKIKYLVQRRPVPDGKVFLQTANDIGVVDPIENLSAKRQELDAKRQAALQRYLNAQMVGRSCAVVWEVAVHDAPEVGQQSITQGGAVGAVNVIGAFPKYQGSHSGSLSGTAGNTTSNTGAAVGGPATTVGPQQAGPTTAPTQAQP